MANEETNKVSSNLKVPPLKIVFSSHHNNAVVNIGSVDEHQLSTSDKADLDNHHKEHGRRNSLDMKDDCDKRQRKNSRSSCDRAESESGKNTAYSSSSSSSSSSDRSTSTTPSSESESLASNSTIISDTQVKNKTVRKDEASSAKQYRVSKEKYLIPDLTPEKLNVNASSSTGKKLQENNSEQTSDLNPINYKEQSLNANQRITRSSQRAAQQSKSENTKEAIIEESIASENQEKVHESSRKVKRRKGEAQDSEQDGAQAIAQPAVTMANIYPADYQLPSQNSFELYQDIRRRLYEKLKKLNYVQPKVPHGFKDYLINGGPYLLDGNKLGSGLSGLSTLNNSDLSKNGNYQPGRIPLRLKLSNPQKLASLQSSQLRHTSYAIPEVSEAPKNLQVDSPLYELFLDQEKARQQMRMQHLKERERSILTAEQEILRTYNKAAIANIRQKLHLSACTYFYYQERYHYLDEKSGLSASIKEVPHCQDNSFLCIEGGDATKTLDNSAPTKKEVRSSYSGNLREPEEKSSDGNKFKQQVDDSMLPNTIEHDELEMEREHTSLEAAVANSNEDIEMSNSSKKILNKETFINELQEIDDKWDKIKKDMLVRHRNEADSLHAVQSLEWEWKAKEIGACDVRVSLKIESGFVPKVEVASIDY